MNNSNKIKIIYLLGAGHSGSTLLDLIMDSHSKIVGVGELVNWPITKRKKDHTFCSCGKKISDCQFWNSVFKNILLTNGLKIYRKKIDFFLNRNVYRFVHKNKKVEQDKYLKFSEEIYQNILIQSGKKVVFDSSKDVDRVDLLNKSNNLEIYFIHLVRDGRGVSCSFKLKRKYRTIFRPMFIWGLSNLKIELFKRRYPKNVIFLKYENFCNNPKQEIKNILEKVNLEFEPQMLKFREKKHHQPEGNRLRFSRDQEIKQNLIWKKKLNFLDKFIFNLFFGWLNFFYQQIKK